MQLDGYKTGCRSCELSFLNFFFFFATNGKVLLDGYKIGCRSCELLLSSSFFFATNGKVQLDRYKIECRYCEFFFSSFFFAANGKVQLDGYKIGCRSCELLFSSFFFCNQWKIVTWWLLDRMSVVWASFLNYFFFLTNGKVQVDGYKIWCQSCQLLFSRFFFATN